MIPSLKYPLAATLLCASLSHAAGLSSYHIGNSLSWDMQPEGLAALAAANGHNLEVGYHISAGMPLNHIAANPDDITLSGAYGGYASALASHRWDAITLQPYIGEGSTLDTDLAAIGQLIDLAEAGPSEAPTYYLYAGWPAATGWAWPPLDGADYAGEWYRQDGSTPLVTDQTAQYFDQLYAQLLGAHPDADIRMIPVGRVLAEVDAQIKAGSLSGLDSVYDLYRDEVHLSYGAGRFLAAATTYAVLFGESPVGLTPPDGYYADAAALDPALREQLQAIAWQVVSEDGRTGVGEVPLPAALPLFAGALGLLGGLRLKRRAA